MKDEKKRTCREGFVAGFREAADFTLNPPDDNLWQFIDRYNSDAGGRCFLANCLGSEIEKLGAVLACNFFIEIGVPDFCKPDTATKNLLREAGLLPNSTEDDYLVFWAVQEIAERTNVEPLIIDKAIWMLRSNLAVAEDWVDAEKRKKWLKRWTRHQ